MKTMGNNMKQFKEWCIAKQITAKCYVGCIEMILDGYLQDKRILSEQRIVEMYETTDTDIKNFIRDVKKNAEVLLVPIEELNENLEKFHQIDNKLAQSIKNYKEAFKKLKQELEAE